MRLKQKLAAMLAVLLILLQGFSAFAVSAEGLQQPESITTAYDSGIPPEVSEPSDALPEQGAAPSVTAQTAKTATTSDTDIEQEPLEDLTEQEPLTQPAIPGDSGNPEDVSEIQPSSQPPEAPIIELKEQSEIPVFNIELVEYGEKPGVYGTLNYIPEDTTYITVLYSSSGVDYEPAENSDDGGDRAWDLSSLSEEDGQQKLTQLCIGVNDYSLKAYQNSEVTSLYIKLEIKRDSGIIQTKPVKLSHEKTLSIPDTLPAFSAQIKSTFEGYVLKGTFTDFLPNTSRVRPLYSLDGYIYEPVSGALEPMDWDLSRLDTEDPKEQAFLQNQICAYATDEPLKSYLKQGLERFYIKLQITTVTGDAYDSQAVVIERGTPQPPPENTTVSANFTASMIAVDRGQRPPYTYGKYQITVKENATSKDVYALLPDTLPIEVQFMQPDTDEIITSGIAECEVNWKEPPELTLTAGEAFTIPDAANELVVPAGTVVSTPLGIYVLSEAVIIDSPYSRDEVRIVVNAIGAEEKPDISLTGNTNDDSVDGFVPLSLAFRFKPSGATSVKAYSYVEGDGKWTEICELLSCRDTNANQSAELYGYVDVLQPDESPYANYLKGEITGFLIGIIIQGGTFDGERVILPWPGEYTPPTRIPDLDGSGGNEGNAGSGDGSGDSTEGGQRPDLPEEGAPPVTTPPPGTSNPPDSSDSTAPNTPENPEPSVPSLPDGNTTPSIPTDTMENGGDTVLSKPPVNPDMMLPTEETGKDTPPLADQRPIKPKYMAELPLVVSQGNTLAAQNVSDNSENAARNLTEPEMDKVAELPVWNEAKPQEQPQEKSDAQAVTRQASNVIKTGGLPLTAAALLLGGGIVTVAVAGAGSAAGGITGTSAVAKLLTALKKIFRHP